MWSAAGPLGPGFFLLLPAPVPVAPSVPPGGYFRLPRRGRSDQVRPALWVFPVGVPSAEAFGTPTVTVPPDPADIEFEELLAIFL